MTARQLLDLGGYGHWLNALELERWLLDQGLAEPNGTPHTLVPTQLAISLAGSLELLGD